MVSNSRILEQGSRVKEDICLRLDFWAWDLFETILWNSEMVENRVRSGFMMDRMQFEGREWNFKVCTF